MKPNKDGTAYEYVACYVDNLAIIASDPGGKFKDLQYDPYNFDFKGSGPLNFHLGYSFGWDEDNTLYMDPSQYIGIRW